MNRKALEKLYHEYLNDGAPESAHLPRLLHYARLCKKDHDSTGVACELGTFRGRTSVALLLSDLKIISVDMDIRPDISRILSIAGDKYQFIKTISWLANLPSCDLLFIDAGHTYGDVQRELGAHADKVRRFLIFHDSITYGSHGCNAKGEYLKATGPMTVETKSELGIRPAIDELMIRDRSWFIRDHYFTGRGLLILERINSGD